MYIVKALVVFILAITTYGCSKIGRIENLVISPSDLKLENKHDSIVSVEVIGGDMRFVSSELFKSSLIKSLNNTGVFRASPDKNNAHYKLSVIMLRSENYSMGSDYIITSKWILSDNSGNIIWSESVTGNGSSSEFGGHARIRASAERASKDTITNGINKLSQLSL